MFPQTHSPTFFYLLPALSIITKAIASGIASHLFQTWSQIQLLGPEIEGKYALSGDRTIVSWATVTQCLASRDICTHFFSALDICVQIFVNLDYVDYGYLKKTFLRCKSRIRTRIKGLAYVTRDLLPS